MTGIELASQRGGLISGDSVTCVFVLVLSLTCGFFTWSFSLFHLLRNELSHGCVVAVFLDASFCPALTLHRE